MTRPGDSPLQSPAEDTLGRAQQASRFASQIASVDASEGLVVGVLGAWGSGKTSFINLARSGLANAGIAVIDFNPWMFSGAEQLVDRFFVELGEELKLRPELAEIGEQFEDYGELFSGLGWLPLAGAWIERGRLLARLGGKAMQQRRQGSRGKRERLTDALSKINHSIVVILDDIDRLTSAEIREIFKLVRLTANFPNVIYLLAFDRERVEQALTDEGVPGRPYLEKILQIAVDLPVLPARVLQRAVTEAIQRAIGEPENPRFDQQSWPDTFIEIISPLISTMRDVRRYEAAIAGTVPTLGRDVDLGDALALEAVRVFLPDVHSQIALAVDGLTTIAQPGMFASTDEPTLKAQVEAVIAAGGERSAVVTAVVRLLFPAAARHFGGGSYGSGWDATWLRDRRVAHRNVLRLFLERTIGDELAVYLTAERAIALLENSRQLEEYLGAIDSSIRADVIREMAQLSDSFNANNAAPALVALLNILPTLPDQSAGMFDLDVRFSVTRMMYLILHRLPPERVVQIVNEVLPQVRTLWGRFELITSVGHRENAGHAFVPEEVAASLEAQWREQLRETPASELLKEQRLLILVWHAKNDVQPNELQPIVEASTDITLALVRSAVSDVRSNILGQRAVRHESRLNWDMLVDVVGGENELRARLEPLRQLEAPEMAELLELVDRYLTGWRPD